MPAQISINELRKKLTNEFDIIGNRYGDETPTQVVENADEWIVWALEVLYSTEKDRIALARQALIKAHARLVLVTPDSEGTP